MKVYRIFFKTNTAPPTAKSCGSAEVVQKSFSDAVTWAENTGKEKGWRVVMVAELPTLKAPAGVGAILNHSWSEQNENTGIKEN